MSLAGANATLAVPGSLTTVGGQLVIGGNVALSSLAGLENLKTVGGPVTICWKPVVTTANAAGQVPILVHAGPTHPLVSAFCNTWCSCHSAFSLNMTKFFEPYLHPCRFPSHRMLCWIISLPYMATLAVLTIRLVRLHRPRPSSRQERFVYLCHKAVLTHLPADIVLTVAKALRNNCCSDKGSLKNGGDKAILWTCCTFSSLSMQTY